MSTTVEYVRFEATDPAELTAQRDRLISLLRERYEADFLGAYLARSKDGSLLDFLIWASPEAAARAAREMPGAPAAAGFFGLIGEVHEMRHAEVLHSTQP
ncbi:hypothetical protein [Streptomyces peucetius]|uniref:ABM domain-containing protein n=1 Tax=Streptomyces peucetius TaxID=1950 RepID=A0ABY6I0A5_STRPE|nr:hypothetical protein [Streptomyces peucetius]UYQ60204.1 hypothetical protein OGH68_01065 [Streptomyces peucetius]